MSQPPAPPLFDEFPPVPPEAWLSQVQKDLKGKGLADFDRVLDGDARVRPFYTVEDMQPLAQVLEAGPGDFPFRRGNVFNATDDAWQAAVPLPDGADAATLVAHIEAALSADFQVFAWRQPTATSVLPIAHIPWSHCALHASAPTAEAAGALLRALADAGVQAVGTLCLPPTVPQDARIALWRNFGAALPYMRLLGLDLRGTPLSLVGQLRALLGDVNGLLAADTGAAAQLACWLPTGPDFYGEMSKLRALRVAVAEAVAAAGVSQAEAQSCFVIAQTADYQPFAFSPKADPLNNLLRATTEALAAAIGGANALVVMPHDPAPEAMPPQPGEAALRSARLARNVHHLLRHEARIAEVKDPAGGSFYVEQFTEALLAAAR